MAMKIKDILKNPVGQKLGGFNLTIKTAKKKWEGDSGWVHQVLVSDDTGEMLVDVNIVKNIPLHRGETFRVVVAEVQQGEKGKKLYVFEYKRIVQIGEPEELYGIESDWDKVNRGKVRHGLVCALIRAGEITIEPITIASKNFIEEMVNYIMTGK